MRAAQYIHRQLLDWFIPPNVRSAPLDEQRRGHVIMWFWLAVLMWSPFYAALYRSFGCDLATGAILLATALASLVPMTVRWTGSLKLAGNIFTLVLTTLLIVLISLTGTHDSPVRVWLVLIPLLAMSLSGFRSTLVWTGAILIFSVVGTILDQFGYAPAPRLSAAQLHLLDTISMATLIAVMCVLALIYERFQRSTIALVEERAAALHRALNRNETIKQELQAMNESLAAQIYERRHAEKALRDSESLLNNVISSIPVLVFWKDRESQYLGCNRRFAEIAGIDQPLDIRGKSDQDLHWPNEGIDWYRATDHEVVSSGRPLLDIEETIHQQDGTGLTLLTSKVPMRDGAGGIIGVLGMSVDITARKQLEERLRLQSSALAAAANAVVITDTTGRICWVNPAFSQLTGYAFEEVVGQFPSILKSGDHEPAFYQRLWATISSGQVWQGQMRNRRKDGSIYHEEMTITPVRGDDQVITHFVGIKQDVTERMRGERLARERDQLRVTVKSHEQFLGVVGHELRTPLAGLMIISEFLLREDARNTSEFETFLHNIHDEVERMSGVVNDLVEVARLNSGIAKFHWGHVNVLRACTEAAASIRPLIDPLRVALEVCVDPPEQTMQGDETAIRRLILNLLSNAQKNTSDGLIRVTGRTIMVASVPYVEISVTDTGAGMSPETAARLGEAFALNAGSVGAPSVAGCGLGLTICRGIVGAHGGSIAIQSKQQEGTTCTLRLRADLAEAATPEHMVEIISQAE